MNFCDLFKIFIKIEFKNTFATKLSFIGYVIGIFINLIVYYFTSKALTPNVQMSQTFLSYGYFEFIVVGELILLLTQASLTQAQDLIIRLKFTGILEQMYFSKFGIVKSLLANYFSIVVVNCIHVFIALLGSVLFFKVNLTASEVFKFVLITCFTSFTFLGIFSLNVLLTLIYRRKNNSLQHVVNLLSFFSGAYFPLQVLGSNTLIKLLALSPLTSLVEFSREFIYKSTVNFDLLIVLLAWLFIPMLLALSLYQLFMKKKLGSYYVAS